MGCNKTRKVFLGCFARGGIQPSRYDINAFDHMIFATENQFNIVESSFVKVPRVARCVINRKVLYGFVDRYQQKAIFWVECCTHSGIPFYGFRQEASVMLLTPKTTTLVSAAGEFYVLSRLCLKGYIAALAPKGVPSMDIVVTDINSAHLFAIQVKARLEKGTDKGWHMNAKHEGIVQPLLFYCFVDFGDGVTSIPTTFVVPSAVVAAALKKTHQMWLRRPGIGGRPHKDSKLRRLVPDYSVYLGKDSGEYGPGWLERYREAWNLLPPEIPKPE